jgi:hypothetical protein
MIKAASHMMDKGVPWAADETVSELSRHPPLAQLP